MDNLIYYRFSIKFKEPFQFVDGENRIPVVNSYREWVIRKDDLDMSGQEANGPICVRLRPDGTTENKVIPCMDSWAF